MIKIRLFCAAGMSTSLLVNKMKAAAKEKGLEADIEAAGETKMNEETDGIDVALRRQEDLRPQGRACGCDPHDRLRHHERQEGAGVRPQAGRQGISGCRLLTPAKPQKAQGRRKTALFKRGGNISWQ